MTPDEDLCRLPASVMLPASCMDPSAQKNAPQDDNDDMDDESMVTANLIFAFYLCIQFGIYNIVLNV
jgi:hypothetical protein